MYNLKNVVLVLILLTFAVACSDSVQEPSIDESTTSTEQYNDSEASSSSDDAVTAVCQSDSNFPCCCKLGGNRSCTTKSECANNGGTCTTNDAYGNCP